MTMRLQLVFVLLFALFQNNDAINENRNKDLALSGRSAFGKVSQLKNWPFIAGIYIEYVPVKNSYGPYAKEFIIRKSYMHQFCTGTLIYKNYILTAGHCVKSNIGTTAHLKATNESITLQLAVVLNTTLDITKVETAYPPPGAIICKVVKQNPHPAYDDKAMSIFFSVKNDIALLKIDCGDQDVSGVDRAKIVRDDPDYWKNGINVKSAGWGDTTDHDTTILREVYSKTMSNDECKNLHRGYPISPIDFESTEICTNSKDESAICKGDSGGPLVINEGRQIGYLIGVASWSLQDCTLSSTGGEKVFAEEKWKKLTPDVFTYVPAYIDWIVETIRKDP